MRCYSKKLLDSYAFSHARTAGLVLPLTKSALAPFKCITVISKIVIIGVFEQYDFGDHSRPWNTALK
jgi:hypothetical protein